MSGDFLAAAYRARGRRRARWMYPNRPFRVTTAPPLPETTEMPAFYVPTTVTSNLLALATNFVAFVVARDWSGCLKEKASVRLQYQHPV
jgi:hypothetical protein